ncbi:5987_t:CDS:2 [Ambispora gerdemannii]|uniref:Signal recognition particle subunit SRP14 n=1 Tax=Ambispora gerdemannii TaxID=144530 RepID=A0A9N9F1K9_9GLOM|nr:5987_t:CDS:2 [Ambispora gerdemannii]
MTLLDNNSFLTQLTRLFEKTKVSGKKVYVTTKRYSYEPRIKKEETNKSKKTSSKNKDDKKDIQGDIIMKTETTTATSLTTLYPCIMRATCGKIKISTLASSYGLDEKEGPEG